jgi:hypothetical protein
MAWSAGGEGGVRGSGCSEQLQATTGAPAGISDMPRLFRMALAKVASGMVGEAAMGRMSMKVDEARQAQLCNRAWDLSPAAPAPLK